MALTDIDAGRLADNVFNNVGPFKNRVINGDMRIDQRNAGSSVTITSSTYTLDRWRAGTTDSSKFSVQQSTTAPAGFTNSLLFTSLSADSGSSSDQYTISQRIEGNNIADLGWGTSDAKTVTLSFWVRSSLTGTFGGSLRNNSTNRSYPFTYAISSADTWEYKTLTIPGDTSGTWDTSTNIGILLNFGLGEGSTFSGPAGAWAAANYTGATGAVQVTATNNATWYITGVQLEVGSVATPFEHRSYGDELYRCQRYYEQQEVYRYYKLGSARGTSGGYAVCQYLVPKRAIPGTITLPPGAQTSDNSMVFLTSGTGFPSTIGSHAANVISTNGFRIEGTGYSGMTNDGTSFLYSGGNQGTSFIKIDAEL